jgi:hypothetical protein
VGVPTGQVYGPYPAIGSTGSGGAPNVNWVANVDLCLPAGDYLILDSDWATWSMNARSAYRGFVILRGDYGTCPGSRAGTIGLFVPKTPPAKTPPPPPPGKSTPAPAPPPPGLSAIKPCYVNTGAIASVGPCFGPPGATLAVRIYNQKRGPFSLLVFKTVVTNGVPAVVTAPLSGNGDILTASAPIKLCVAKAPNKW